MPSYSGVWTLTAQYQARGAGEWNPPNISGDIGLFCGGYSTTFINVIQYITITSTGNATDFGDLIGAYNTSGGCSSGTRGLIGGGRLGVSQSNVIQYVTITSTGNATDFGDLTAVRDFISAASNSTRGIWGGGNENAVKNIIDYVTIATTGNATDFGDLTLSRAALAACSSSTRTVFGGGNGTGTTPSYATMDYVTVASTGNAVGFGSLTQARGNLSACSSSTRGLFGGGFNEPAPQYYWNIIDYVTIATTGSASDFGDLVQDIRNTGSTSNQTRGVWGGGQTARTNVIQYVTMASTGNATDFGDLLAAEDILTACSNAHGGLS